VSNAPINFQDWIITGSVVGLVLSAWMVAILIWSLKRGKRQDAVKQRIGIGDGVQGPSRTLHLWHDNEDVTTVVSDTTQRYTLKEKYLRALSQTGWSTPPRTINMMLANVVIVVFMLTLMLTLSLLAAVCAVALVFSIFWIFVNQAVTKQNALAERQLVDAMQLISRSLRAGHPLYGSFQLVSEELEAPMNHIFRDICQEQSLGLGLDQALRRVAERSDMMDLKLFSTSVAIQLKSGGNLADMMERLAFVIKERIRLAKRVRTLTSQTQASKRLLLFLPVFMFGILNIVNPKYMRPIYEEPLGHMMLAAAVISMICGNWLMNRIATLKY
jgi:tight adherence protein B